MGLIFRQILWALLGSTALSVFESKPFDPRDDRANRTVEDSAAGKERMLLMGRIGRGEITLEQAKALYGADLSGVTSNSTLPAATESYEPNANS